MSTSNTTDSSTIRNLQPPYGKKVSPYQTR